MRTEEGAARGGRGVLQTPGGLKNDSLGQEERRPERPALFYSRLGPLILQDLQAAVQCVPVFVCLQALQDTRGRQCLATSPCLGPLSPPSQPPTPTCILVLITSRGVFPKTLAAPAMAPKTPVISGFIGLLGLSPGCEYSCSQNTGVSQKGALKARKNLGQDPRKHSPRSGPQEQASLQGLEWVSGPQVYLGTSCAVKS